MNRGLSRVAAGLAVAAFAISACGDDDDAGSPATDTDGSTVAGVSEESAPEPSGEGLVLDGEVVADQALLDAARAEGVVRLYTTGTEEGTTAINEAFTADTGIEVEFFRAPGAELTQRILAEADGGVHNFDVVTLTSPFDMLTLKDEGLLAGYEPLTVNDHLIVPDEVDPDKTFYPLYAWLYVIGVNRGVIGDDVVIESWDDIVAPAFKGQLGITPAGVGGTGLAQAAFQKEVLGGTDYWEKLRAVEPVIFSTTATVAESLARGEISVAIAAESAMAPSIAAGAPIELVYPDDGVIGGVSYQGVSSRAEHEAAAQLFQNWSLSKRGQTAVATAAGARPIRDDAGDAAVEGVDLPAQRDITIWWSNLPGQADTKDALVAEWNAAVGYTQDG